VPLRPATIQSIISQETKPMTRAELQQHILSYLLSQAASLQLDAGTLKAERALNWSGFGSDSYHVGDGNRSIHVKLATDHTDMRGSRTTTTLQKCSGG
jgi:hypothetical protein